MNKRFLRRIAISLIGLLVFAQASVTFAYCPMDRGMLSLTTEAGEENPCADGGTAASAFDSLYANRCTSHCTADLQLSGAPSAFVSPAIDAPVLRVAPPAPDFRLAALHAPPPGEVPRRILLHSYLI